MRGGSTFSKLFTDDQVQVVEKQQGKGRNEDLIEARNALLLDRYFFYGHYTDKRHAKILENMRIEFFIVERRIVDIVSEHISYLQKLRKAPPSLKDLQQKYPHFNWELKY